MPTRTKVAATTMQVVHIIRWNPITLPSEIGGESKRGADRKRQRWAVLCVTQSMNQIAKFLLCGVPSCLVSLAVSPLPVLNPRAAATRRYQEAPTPLKLCFVWRSTSAPCVSCRVLSYLVVVLCCAVLCCTLRCAWGPKRTQSTRTRPAPIRCVRAVPPRRPFEKASVSSISRGR